MKFFSNGLVAIGVFIGIAAVIVLEFYVDFFGSSIEPSDTLVATILGATIALTGTLFTIFAADESREKAQKQRDLELLYMLFQRLNEICSNLKFLRNHILASISEAEKNNSDAICVAVRPISGSIKRAQIPYDSLTLLLVRGKSDLYNKTSGFDLLANGQFDAFEHAQLGRDRLLEIIQLGHDGKKTVINFLEENEEEATGRMRVLDEHFKEQVKDLENFLATGMEAINETGTAIREFGHTKFEFELKKSK